MFQETIKTTQIGRFDGHVRRRWNLCIRAGQRNHGVGRERLLLSQQVPQRVIHGRFAVAGRMLQKPQVLARGDPRSVLVPQPVIGQAKAAVGEQVLAIAVVFEGTWLPHQLVDDVPIVDRVLVASHQPRQCVDVNSCVPEFHPIGREPGFDFLADQPAVDRVGIAVNVDQAPRVHTHRHPQTTILPLHRKRPQRRQFLTMPLLPGRVTRGDHRLEKPQVFLAAGEVPAATQKQGLVHGRLEVAVGRFAVAVLVRLADVDPFARQAVMFQQPQVTRLKFTFGRQVVDRRTEAVAAVPLGHSSQFPQRVLKAVRQRLERLRRAEGHRLPVGVREHEVIRQMLEALAEDGDSQRAHVGEVRGRQVTGVMHLAEHDRTSSSGRGPPLPNAALERAAVALGQLTGMLALEPVEQRFGPQAGLRFQTCLSPLP